VDETLNIARWLCRSAVNGPGERFVLWVQGCSIRCPGCCNPDTWTTAPRCTVTVRRLLREISNSSGIEGVTLTGGEPFEQPEALASFASEVQAMGLSMFVNTGFELDDLVSPAQRQLLALSDVVVSGPYCRELDSPDLLWRGSSNQQIGFLSGRYDPDEFPDVCGELEVHIGPEGGAVVTGFPPTDWVRSGVDR